MKHHRRHSVAYLLLALLAGLTVACGISPSDDSDVETPPATRPPAGPAMATAGDDWPLWVDGPHLRGANVYQRRVYPELDGLEFMGPGPVGPPYTQADFDRLAALGANYVNVSHPGLFTEDPPYALDQSIQDNLDNLLAMIAQADMFAVISFRTGPGRAEFSVCCLEEAGDWYDESYLNDAVWQDQAAQDAWAAMWRYTAERYRDTPVVVGYDLMVEPNANEVWLDLWEPDEFHAKYAGTLYDWNQLYPRITAAIREVDGETPILVGSMGYSGVAWLPYLEPTDDLRTVYVVHQYAPHQYTHQAPGFLGGLKYSYLDEFDADWDGEDEQFDRTWLDDLLSAVDTFAATHSVPLAANEFGVVRWVPGAAAFMDDQMDLFEQRGMNHALWMWAPSWAPWEQENDAFNFRHGADPHNHTDLASSDLMDVILKYWARNTVRPSTFAARSAATRRADGAARLTDPPPGASDQNPAFSPDGTRLVFTRFEKGYNEGPSALHLLDLGSGAISLLTAAPDSDNVNLPGSAWNGALDRIVFSSDRECQEELWTILPDGGGGQMLTCHTRLSAYREPSWSPDGEWIVFEMHFPDVGGEIWKVRADGSEQTQLTQLTDFDARQPNWSPDGGLILFQARGSSEGDWEIYTLAPDGSGLRSITADPNAEDSDASWSPDGRYIVYSSDHGGLTVPSLFVIPADGGEPVRVTHTATHEDSAPSWSPDGQWIAFESRSGGEAVPAALWRIAAPALPGTTAQPCRTLADVTHWLYLIDVDLAQETVERIAASEYELVVLDFIPSESENTDYPMADVVAQLHGAFHLKLMLAYVDIGEAEDCCTYWQPGWRVGDPVWIAGDDPDGWEGNFPVAYWYDEWREIWLGEGGTLSAIMAAGFDGVYLDWVEAYSDESIVAIAERDGVDPLQEMIWWIEDIADFARARQPGFIVIGQNAAELAERDDYLMIVDAIAQEQVWFDGGADNDPPGDCPPPRSEAEVDTETYRQSLSPACRKVYDDYPDGTLHVSSEEYLCDLACARQKGVPIFTGD
jgi:TolB protein